MLSNRRIITTPDLNNHQRLSSSPTIEPVFSPPGLQVILKAAPQLSKFLYFFKMKSVFSNEPDETLSLNSLSCTSRSRDIAGTWRRGQYPRDGSAELVNSRSANAMPSMIDYDTVVVQDGGFERQRRMIIRSLTILRPAWLAVSYAGSSRSESHFSTMPMPFIRPEHIQSGLGCAQLLPPWAEDSTT